MPKICLRAILFAIVTGGSATAAAIAGDSQTAPPAGTLNVGYTIAFWDIPFGQTSYEGKFAAGGYDAKSHFETSGIVSLFWKSKIDATANGAIRAHEIAPVLYDSYSQDHNSKVQRVKVSVENDDPTTFADPPYNTTKYPVSAQQKKGAVDPMSAVTLILTGVKADSKNPCGVGAQVFDGRRRFDIAFSYLKDEPVKLANGVWGGTAHLCQIHYNQIAGYKQKIIKEGKALPPMFIDFADVPAAGAPNGHFVVAVKMWSTLSWGTVSVTLSELKVDGKAPEKG
jgi:hypothetical protein